MNRDLAEHPLQRAATFQDVERAARDARSVV